MTVVNAQVPQELPARRSHGVGTGLLIAGAGWVAIMVVLWPVAVPSMVESWALEPGSGMLAAYLLSSFSLGGLAVALPGIVLVALNSVVLGSRFGQSIAARSAVLGAAVLLVPAFVASSRGEGLQGLTYVWVCSAAWVFGYILPSSLQLWFARREQARAVRLLGIGSVVWLTAVAVIVLGMLLRGDASWAM